MMKEKERLKKLARDVMLLNSIGEVITLQVELNDIGGNSKLLEEAFVNAEEDGLFVNSMILLSVLENKFYDYSAIFDKIIDITGDFETIDAVTALIRVNTGKISLEMTVELSFETDHPNLLETTNNAMYFELVRYIQTRWLLAKNALKLGSK